MNNKTSLIISFPDQSKSFTYGVEYGGILQQMQDGKEVVMNHGFPIRIENKGLIIDSCKEYGYIPVFGETYFDEWVGFLGLKKQGSEN